MTVLSIVGCIVVGWLLGILTAMYIGARLTRQQKARRKAALAHMQVTGELLDPEIIAALEHELARVKEAAARVQPVGGRACLTR